MSKSLGILHLRKKYIQRVSNVEQKYESVKPKEEEIKPDINLKDLDFSLVILVDGGWILTFTIIKM